MSAHFAWELLAMQIQSSSFATEASTLILLRFSCGNWNSVYPGSHRTDPIHVKSFQRRPVKVGGKVAAVPHCSVRIR
ncbi:hypothetical protein B0H34DRAFT_754968 [Crassisporium funariophilum]|nr:hypothetical protein B0H34DRAFT_754968 [Crassisporium funariophilum]